MSSQEENQPTTFGAIIERKTPLTPAHTGNATAKSPVVLQSSLPPTTTTTPRSHSPIAPLHSSPVRPHLHLASARQAVEAPLPSPYSIPDSPHDRALDLEAGTYKAPVPSRSAAAAPTNSEPSNNTLVADVRPITPTRQISSASTASSSTAGACNGMADEKLVDSRVHECTMWPTQDALRQKAKKEKAQRCRNPFVRLSKRNKVIVSVTIALTIIGAAVGIGVGVSRAYHGEVWAGNGKNVPIPS